MLDALSRAAYTGNAYRILAVEGFDTSGGSGTLPGKAHDAGQLIINWLIGVAAFCGVVGGVSAGITMMWARNGHGDVHPAVGKLGWVFGGLAVACLSGAAVTAVLNKAG